MPFPHDLARPDHRHLAAKLHDQAFTSAADLHIELWRTPEPVPFAQRRRGQRQVVKPGDRWGTNLFDCAWFHFTGRVPNSARGRQIVALIDMGGELLVVDAKGNPDRGLTCIASDFDLSLGMPGKRIMPLLARSRGGEAIELWGDGANNDLFGKLRHGGAIVEARIATVRPALRALAWDWEVLADLLAALPDQEPRKSALRQVLDAWAPKLSQPDDATVAAARTALAPLLAARGAPNRPTVSCIGHAHLDLAWLWPLRETRRKAARTLSTALRNIETYPDYIFGLSQPQQLAWIEVDHPALFRQVVRRLREGRIEPQGAMWVESDTNLVSGESLVRQLVQGQRAWRRYAGRTMRMCWLPDVFGYSAALPQLLCQAGVEWFQTIKLSWSRVNAFPHHTFRWQGLDGSEVLAHLPPEGTYNSAARPSSLRKAVSEFRDATRSDRMLLPFGIGDGGGGPGEEHLERLARLTDLDGVPRTVCEPAEQFFSRIDQDRSVFATWRGELYLECHQGTFTTQGRLKRLNRQLEWRLRSAETACTRAWLSGETWPQDRFDRIWREVLLHQFHDILPGSSIGRVYREAEARSLDILAELDGLIATADAALPAGTWVVNDLSWSRQGWLCAGDRWHRVEAAGLACVSLGEACAEPGAGLTAHDNLLDNGIVRARFADDGRLRSLTLLEGGRETLAAPGNDLLCFADSGDAWDFSMDYLRQEARRPVLVITRTMIAGPEAIIEQTWRIGVSTITQRIVLAAGSRRLEFRTVVDWQERGCMLRVRFPTTVDPGEARCAVAFGSLARPTHANTSWDAARYEVPAHEWVDLSERGFGVALLNDGKYGYRLDGGVLDLALLRSPGFPDPDADRGAHVFTYAIYPHAGDHADGAVVREAHDLNHPLRVGHGSRGGKADPSPIAIIDHPDVAVSAVKRSDDGDDLVVRIHETHGTRATLHLRTTIALRGAAQTDLLEEHPKALPKRARVVEVEMPPYAVRTLRLQRR